MSDQLYLSLWFPNFTLATLPSALASVMRQFALISGPEGKRVAAAAAYPISFSEAPTFQRVYINDDRSEETSASIIENSVAEATEQLHDDMAYEFEMRWKLWTPDSGPGSPGYTGGEQQDEGRLDPLWRPEPATVRILGFGPHFDDAAFEQNGHIRVDFGLDYPWVLDDVSAEDEADEDHIDAAATRPEEDDEPTSATPTRTTSNLLAFRPPASPSDQPPATLPEAAQYIQRNVEMLLAFTLSVEKHCGISSRLLWTESGEPLAEKLIARLQRLN